MSDVRSWLAHRRPQPPRALAGAIDAALGEAERNGLLGTLSEGAERALGAALSAPGRVRASAFQLLTADALLTYACEAALEGDEPARELARLAAGLVHPDA